MPDRVEVYASEREIADWKLAAKEVDRSLSAWARRALNNEAQQKAQASAFDALYEVKP